MKKTVILNGPPGSGKDTIAKLMFLGPGHYGFEWKEMKTPLVKTALEISNISVNDWMDRYSDREKKEEPWSRLGGLSQREFLIKISEEWIKPVFGDDYYGILAAKSVEDSVMNVVFSDGGFIEEFEAMEEVLGYENIFLVHLKRSGCSFEGDSRGYIERRNGITIEVDQDGKTPKESVQEIMKYLR